jgi:RHS repeat-associated protein
MHEHLDEFQLINMNGRVYDPLTAQFLSPDPYVQAPGDWLNYNRYGYAFGNPFKYTDPSGEWIHILIGAIIGGVINWGAHGFEFSWDGLVAFGIGAAGGALAAATGGAVLASYGTGIGAGGFVGGAISGGAAYTSSTMVTSMGNNIAFGDPMPTGDQLASGMFFSMLTAGAMNGTLAATNGRNFWNGTLKTPQWTMPNLESLATPQVKQATLDNFKTPLKEMPNNNVMDNTYILDNQPQLTKLGSDGINIAKSTNFRDPNFRANLIKASGFDPGKTAQAHHVFPAAYGKEFAVAGVDVNRYGVWWETGSHLKNAYQYNQAWKEFFRVTSNPTQTQIYNEALKLKMQFGY